MLVDLKDRIDLYNMVQGEASANMEKTVDGQVVMAICTPVMKRVHTKLRESGEIIFVDSSGNCALCCWRIAIGDTHNDIREPIHHYIWASTPANPFA